MSDTVTIQRPTHKVVQKTNGVYVQVPTTYAERWKAETTYHCPYCATKQLYYLVGGSDYDAGETYVCTKCSATFSMGEVYDDETSKERVSLIRAAIEVPE